MKAGQAAAEIKSTVSADAAADRSHSNADTTVDYKPQQTDKVSG